MKKVYDDPKLPYSQDTKFVYPPDYQPCGAFYGGEGSVDEPGEDFREEEIIESAFD